MQYHRICVTQYSIKALIVFRHLEHRQWIPYECSVCTQINDSLVVSHEIFVFFVATNSYLGSLWCGNFRFCFSFSWHSLARLVLSAVFFCLFLHYFHRFYWIWLLLRTLFSCCNSNRLKMFFCLVDSFLLKLTYYLHSKHFSHSIFLFSLLLCFHFTIEYWILNNKCWMLFKQCASAASRFQYRIQIFLGPFNFYWFQAINPFIKKKYWFKIRNRKICHISHLRGKGVVMCDWINRLSLERFYCELKKILSSCLTSLQIITALGHIPEWGHCKIPYVVHKSYSHHKPMCFLWYSNRKSSSK